MIQNIKNIVKRTFFYDMLVDMRLRRGWSENRSVSLNPRHLAKIRTVKEYAEAFSIQTLIETGTYMGDIVYGTRASFTKIISVGLDEILYKLAKRRFSDYSHISIMNGDSGEVLPEILADMEEPCLFWLDGHYSSGNTAQGLKDTPILQEVLHILDHPVEGHVILIDDARKFVGIDDYPTIAELRSLVLKRRPYEAFSVDNDIIRIHMNPNPER